MSSFWRRQWHPLQCSCLQNPMDDGEAWWATVHGVTKSQRRLSNFIFTFHFHALEKEIATHSNILAWRIPGTDKPGELLSMGWHRVGHDLRDLAAAVAEWVFPLPKIILCVLSIHPFLSSLTVPGNRWLFIYFFFAIFRML